jgi:DNA-directed RNA polymerase subunit RPC12/RpoP
MDCKRCGYRMRIDKNLRIGADKFRLVYICTSCGYEYEDDIEIL